MAHLDETKLIHSIDLGDKGVYEIHDAHAVHSIEDLNNLGLEGAFVFKGTVQTVSKLPTNDNTVGDVWHVTANDSEYVWTSDEEWEEFGTHIVVEHVHDIDSISGHNSASAVSGSATVTGSNASSSVSGSASIANAPKVSAEAKYAKVSTGNDTFVKSYPGATSKMVTTSVTPAGTATSVVSSITPSTASITGVSGSTEASKVTANNVVITPAVDNGVLSFVIGASCEVSAVSVPKAATNATTVVTGVETDSKNVATVGTAVTVATGTLANNGSGSSVMTGLGTADTASALTSASLVAGTSSDGGIHTGDDVTVETQTLSGTISGTAAAQTWTQNTGTISGTAAAQAWTFDSGVTETPKNS